MPHDVAAFLAWGATVPGRHALVAGEVVAMAPERACHARVTFALDRGLRALGVPGEMRPDGITVRIDAHTADEPDALVYCGPERPPTRSRRRRRRSVEGLSPGTRSVDAGATVAGGFLVPGVMHYRLVDPRRACLIHHRRIGATIETRIVTEGTLSLDPPGIGLAVDDLSGERRGA
ncbi:Uma2 family endonuclease [Methylobacterium terricola]|uniref:Uma2 family endonuclease n=1 Tax=Methylobacterium terricola TaxID=2583531 RepID=A0A5C4LLB2_9HYPH|nr:Uma2 family endonuclease [Methylobacterium terricola]TNC14465.1 Uma2 family endonuclease [Methylobacterium terricola]